MGLYCHRAGTNYPPPPGFVPCLEPDDGPGQPHSWPRCHTPTSLGKLAGAPQPGAPHTGAPAHASPSADPSQHRRRRKTPVPATYLKEPVAPPVEGGDDGGMDIAAVQALGREEKREFSWKEGRKGGRRREGEGAGEGHRARQPRGPEGLRPRQPRGPKGQAPLGLAPGPRTRTGTVPKEHSWQMWMDSWGAYPLGGRGGTWELRKARDQGSARYCP